MASVTFFPVSFFHQLISDDVKHYPLRVVLPTIAPRTSSRGCEVPKLLQDGPGVKWEQQHLELVLRLPTIVYDRGGDFDEAVGTEIERRLVELDSAGFIAIERPGEAMIDIKFTACGRALLGLLWDHADRMHRRGFYNGDAPLPRAADIIGDALRGA